MSDMLQLMYDMLQLMYDMLQLVVKLVLTQPAKSQQITLIEFFQSLTTS